MCSFIRLKMKSNVVLKQLSIGISNSDQSYTPQLVGVSVGKSPHFLKEIKEVRVPRYKCNFYPDNYNWENTLFLYSCEYCASLHVTNLHVAMTAL